MEAGMTRKRTIVVIGPNQKAFALWARLRRFIRISYDSAVDADDRTIALRATRHNLRGLTSIDAVVILPGADQHRDYDSIIHDVAIITRRQP